MAESTEIAPLLDNPGSKGLKLVHAFSFIHDLDTVDEKELKGSEKYKEWRERVTENGEDVIAPNVEHSAQLNVLPLGYKNAKMELSVIFVPLQLISRYPYK